MFTKILIANRGEIACRIIRTARAMGIRTVAIYSDADRNALHVAMADEAIHIGAAPSRESYLLGDRVIEAAIKTGAQAIHPGYGFLSENAGFCRACEKNKLVFIGPPAKAIEAMGSKSAAKEIMENANVPQSPGYHGEDQSFEVLIQAADKIGYPVLLKAVAGGGGKGMREVWQKEDFKQALDAAKRESLSSFGDNVMLVEKYITQPRHIEIQIFCDQHGNAVYLFERDCSVQRRYQKVIEEAPGPGITQTLREQMGETAIRAAQAIDYQGAGTVEFLLDKEGTFYFMEMNTRLQVEHPVTEMISGQDLVEWQLRVAAGEPLPQTQDQLQINGHAFEARIYAEDPDNDFMPATGTLEFLQTPVPSNHVRVDTGVLQGDEISIYYDPMIAKLIVWDENRTKALQRLIHALSEYRINGVCTNINFLYNLVSCQPFVDADLDTGFIEKHHEKIFRDSATEIEQEIPVASLFMCLEQSRQAEKQAGQSNDPYSPWHLKNGWKLNQARQQHFSLKIHGQIIEINTEQVDSENAHCYHIHWGDHTAQVQGCIKNNQLLANINEHQFSMSIAEHSHGYSLYGHNGAINFSLVEPDLEFEDVIHSEGGLDAPINGAIVALLVEVGEKTAKGDMLLVMESMKIEYSIQAPADGTVKEFYFKPGDLVDAGTELLAYEKQE